MKNLNFDFDDLINQIPPLIKIVFLRKVAYIALKQYGRIIDPQKPLKIDYPLNNLLNDEYEYNKFVQKLHYFVNNPNLLVLNFVLVNETKTHIPKALVEQFLTKFQQEKLCHFIYNQ